MTEIAEFPMPRATGCPFDPPPALSERQQDDAPAKVRIWDGSTPWLVTRYDDFRTLLTDPRLSADPRNGHYPRLPIFEGAENNGDVQTFLMMDDPEHARLRRMVTAPFAIKRMEALRPAVQKIVDDLIDEMLAGPQPADLVTALALPVPSRVICELLGVPYADHDFFQESSAATLRTTVPAEQRAEAMRALFDYLDRLVAAKIADPADDLLSQLAQRVHTGEMTAREVAQMGLTLLVAGHETTANMISLGTAALLRDPEQLALLRDGDDPTVVASAVEELLRYLSITHSGRRRVAVDDIEIAGRTIRTGDGVILANNVANRDPRTFPDPDDLDLTRDARRHVAFGFGVHQCLGQPLARLELQVVYGTLYRRVPTLALATPVEHLPFKTDGTVYGVYCLPVTW